MGQSGHFRAIGIPHHTTHTSTAARCPRPKNAHTLVNVRVECCHLLMLTSSSNLTVLFCVSATASSYLLMSVCMGVLSITKYCLLSPAFKAHEEEEVGQEHMTAPSLRSLPPSPSLQMHVSPFCRSLCPLALLYVADNQCLLLLAVSVCVYVFVCVSGLPCCSVGLGDFSNSLLTGGSIVFSTLDPLYRPNRVVAIRCMRCLAGQLSFLRVRRS